MSTNKELYLGVRMMNNALAVRPPIESIDKGVCKDELIVGIS